MPVLLSFQEKRRETRSNQPDWLVLIPGGGRGVDGDRLLGERSLPVDRRTPSGNQRTDWYFTWTGRSLSLSRPVVRWEVLPLNLWRGS